MTRESFVPLAVVERSDCVESLHFGAFVVLDGDGRVERFAGDPNVSVFGRSAWKPVQACAMVANGLDLPDELLAIVCASHSGSPVHRQYVDRILAGVGLSDAALRNTPDLPLDRAEADLLVAQGGRASATAANCSGKHAGMIATCVHNKWSMDGAAYLKPDHPVQERIRARIEWITDGAAIPAGRDGCGAPTFMSTLYDLACAFRRIVLAEPRTPEHAVYRAMVGHPDISSGPGRIASDFMRAVPGLLAKDGAEGIFAAALPNGRALAVKVADGNPRAWRAIIPELLSHSGVDVSGLGVTTTIRTVTDSWQSGR